MFTLVEAEHYLVEVDHSTFVKGIIPLVVKNDGGSLAIPEFLEFSNSDTVVGAVDKTGGAVTGADITAASAYVRNYRFPAYRV